MKELQERLSQKNITFTINDTILEEAQRRYEKECVARLLKRALNHFITVPLSQYLLRNSEAHHIHLELENSALKISEE